MLFMIPGNFSYKVPSNVFDEASRSRYRHFNTCCQLTVLTMVVIVLSNEFFEFHQAQPNSIIFLVFFSIICVCFYYNLWPLTLAVNLYIAAGTAQVAASALVSGGFKSPVVFWCILIPLYAFWLLNKRYALLWFFVALILPIMFLVLSISEIHYTPAYDFFEEGHRFFALIIILFLILNVFIVGNSFETNKVNSIREVNKVNEELRETLAKLEETKRELETAEKHKDLFISQMSHEMRTPMTAIIGVSELLKAHLQDDHEELLQILDRSSKNLLYIIDDILDITKIKTGKFHYQKVPFEFAPLLNSIYKSNKLRADEKKLSLVRETDNNLPAQLTGDPFRITQIINNILGNAIKFTESGEVKLIVGFNRDLSVLSITVTDTGIGMSETEVRKAFDIFSQANSDIHLKYGGTGMGLSITKQLVELFGGKIMVKSRPGKGTLVNIYLPMDVVTAPDQGHKQQPDYKRKIEEIFPGIKILIAEDNEVNQLVIKRILRSELPSAVIEFASDGDQVLSMIESTPYDVVLMDIQMPGKDGITTTKIIRAHPSAGISNLKIIALTAQARKTEAENCLAIGMNAYTTKPIDKDDLFRKISDLVAC